MKLTVMALAASAILASSGFAMAEEHYNQPPGQQMQQNGSQEGPGASGYAPGHEMQENGKEGRGASDYSPGRSTTGQGENSEQRHDEFNRESDHQPNNRDLGREDRK